jgi:hypothetical protein
MTKEPKVHYCFPKKDDLDKFIRGLLKEQDLSALDAVKMFCQSFGLLDGFISKHNLKKELIEFIQQFPDYARDPFLRSLRMSIETGKEVKRLHEKEHEDG